MNIDLAELLAVARQRSTEERRRGELASAQQWDAITAAVSSLIALEQRKTIAKEKK